MLGVTRVVLELVIFRRCHDRLSVHTSASVVSVMTFGMTSGVGSGRDQCERAINDAAPCRDQSSPARSEISPAARQFRRTGCKLRTACRRHSRKGRRVGCCRAKGDRDGFRAPSRCHRKRCTPWHPKTKFLRRKWFHFKPDHAYDLWNWHPLVVRVLHLSAGAAVHVLNDCSN